MVFITYDKESKYYILKQTKDKDARQLSSCQAGIASPAFQQKIDELGNSVGPIYILHNEDSHNRWASLLAE